MELLRILTTGVNEVDGHSIGYCLVVGDAFSVHSVRSMSELRYHAITSTTRAQLDERDASPSLLVLLRTRVFSVGYTDTRGIFGGRTELSEVSGTGMEFVQNHTGVFGRVFRPYRTSPRTSVGYLPRKYPRDALVRVIPYRTHSRRLFSGLDQTCHLFGGYV